MAEVFEKQDVVGVTETLADVGELSFRKELPIQRPKGYSGLWSVIKSAIGKDVTRVTLPVQFNEPISFLQRLTEDLADAHLLDTACGLEDSLMRMVYVSAFANTFWSSTGEGHRIYKPFNPLLGETFELVRDGYRCIVEQVSHHPPISAIHVESKHGWIFSQEYRCDTRFRTTLKVTANGPCRVFIPKYGDRYTYKKPVTTVHNLIFGKLWVDNEGDIEVVNHHTGEKGVMHWLPYGSVGKKYTQLTGQVHDKEGKVVYTIHGGWAKGFILLDGDVPKRDLPDGLTAVERPGAKVIWKVADAPPDSKEMYGMATFTMGLNMMVDNVAPTDSRYRPDQKYLEEGVVDKSASEKRRLEDKQRSAKKARDKAKAEYKPTWFVPTTCKDSGLDLHIYKGGYWDAKKNGDFETKKDTMPDIY